jgi:hypothetical protein
MTTTTTTVTDDHHHHRHHNPQRPSPLPSNTDGQVSTSTHTHKCGRAMAKMITGPNDASSVAWAISKCFLFFCVLLILTIIFSRYYWYFNGTGWFRVEKAIEYV